MPPKKFQPVDDAAVVVDPMEAKAPEVVAPGYVTEYEVRLRHEDMPLVVSIDGTEHGHQVTHKVSLIPNKWMIVPECISILLKEKFALREDLRQVPDSLANERNPHGRNDDAIMREEAKPGYIIEFREHQKEIQ